MSFQAQWPDGPAGSERCWYNGHQRFILLHTSNNRRKKNFPFFRLSKKKAFRLICLFKCSTVHEFLLDALPHTTLLRNPATFRTNGQYFQNMKGQKWLEWSAAQKKKKKENLSYITLTVAQHFSALHLNASLRESEDASSIKFRPFAYWENGTAHSQSFSAFFLRHISAEDKVYGYIVSHIV